MNYYSNIGDSIIKMIKSADIIQIIILKITFIIYNCYNKKAYR